MSSFSALKTAIQAAIKQNGNNEITGDILQDILLSIVSTLGDSAINNLETGLSSEASTRGNADTTLQTNINKEATARQNADTQLNNLITGIKNNIDNGYVYAGIATPSTTPVSGKVFYIATQAGTYTNLGNTAVKPGISILKYNGSTWSNEQVNYTDGGVFDVSAYNGGATYASLEALLSAANLSTIIPSAVRKGGMSIKFVQSSDHKYIQARCMADSFTTDVTQWQGVDDEPTTGSNNLVKSGGVTNKYGDWVFLNTNYIYVLTDKNGIIILAIKEDYSIYYGRGIPLQIQEELNKKVNSIIDKTLIQSDFANSMTVEELGMWVSASIAADNSVIFGIKKDGTSYFYRMESPTLDEITGRNTSIMASEYVNVEADNALIISTIPEMTKACEVVEIRSENDLDEAINSFNQGNSIVAVLKNDIHLTNSKLLQSSSNSEITINGCGHSIYQVNAEYVPAGYKGGMAYSEYVGNLNGHEKFIGENGNILSLSKTSYYQADSRITDENGGTFDTVNSGTGTVSVPLSVKFKLPSELASLTITEADNVFINFSTWFVSYTYKVKSAANGYLHFEHTGGYNVDGDYYFAKKYCSFCLINLRTNSDSVTIKDNKIFFPSENGIIYGCGNSNNFVVSNSTGIVKFERVSFKTGASSVPVINVLNSTTIIESCEFEGNVTYCISVGVNDPLSVTSDWGAGSVYINNSKFSNLGAGAVNANEDTLCYFTNNTIHNCGQVRSNSYGVRCAGKYYICNNNIRDFGYSAISTGIPSMTEQHNCLGIIENNIIYQTLEYFNNAVNNVVMDAGAIYLSTNHVNTIVRYNRIFNYKGRYANRGIFCDGGDYNIKVYSNIVNNTPNSRSIDAYAPDSSYGTAGNIKNINKVIAQNIVDGNILLEGNSVDDLQDTLCYLGHNLLVGAYSSVSINNVTNIESQIKIYSLSISDGICPIAINENPWYIN